MLMSSRPISATATDFSETSQLCSIIVHKCTCKNQCNLYSFQSQILVDNITREIRRRTEGFTGSQGMWVKHRQLPKSELLLRLNNKTQ